MSLIPWTVNFEVDALEVLDRTTRKMEVMALHSSNAVSKIFQHTLYRDRMRLLFKGFQGSDYSISMPQLHGIDEPYLCQIPFHSNTLSWLKPEVARAAFEDEHLNADNDHLQDSSKKLLESVREAFCIQTPGGNHLKQISDVGTHGLASALEQNITQSNLIISFDIRKAFLDASCGSGVLGPVAMIPERWRNAIYNHILQTFFTTGNVSAGKVNLSLSRLNNMLREGRSDVQSCLVGEKGVSATSVWHKLMIQATMIIASLSAWDCVMERGLEESLTRYYPEELCLASQECGVDPDLKYNRQSRIEMGVTQFVCRYIATRTTILRAMDRYNSVNWEQIDARAERFHKNVPVKERQQTVTCIDAVPVLWKKIIQLGDVSKTRKGRVCLGEKDLIREAALYKMAERHIGSDDAINKIDCNEGTIIQTFLYNLLKFEKLDEDLVDSVFSKAKIMKKTVFKSDGCIIIISKQTRTAVILFKDGFEESIMGSAGGENLIGRTPKSKGKALVAEVLALLSASCSNISGAFCRHRFQKVTDRNVKSLTSVIEIAKGIICKDLKRGLLRTSTIEKRLEMVRQYMDKFDYARAERYLTHILAEAAERIYTDRDVGDCYYEGILQKKTLELTDEDANCSGLLIDCGVCVTGLESKRSPYIPDRMLVKWDIIKWHNREFMVGHDGLDVMRHVGRSGGTGVIQSHLELAEDYEGEQHWTINDHINAIMYVQGVPAV